MRALVMEPRVLLASPQDSIQVALVQTNHHGILAADFGLRPGSKAVKRHEVRTLRGIVRCMRLGASVVCLPEYSATPSLLSSISAMIRGSPVAVIAGTLKLTRNAVETDMGSWIGGSPPTPKDLGKNVGFVLTGSPPEVCMFQKVSLSDEEVDKIRPGNAITILNLKYGQFRKNLRIGLLVCHDLMEMALVAKCYEVGVNLLLIPSYNRSPSRFENWRPILCENYQGVVAIVNVAEKGGHYGATQLWAFQPKDWCAVPPPEGYELMRITGFASLGFPIYPESVFRRVNIASPFRPLVHPRYVWSNSLYDPTEK